MTIHYIQCHLFESALAEHGIAGKTDYDHKNGINYINKIPFDIKYPLSYIENIQKLSREKFYKYSFAGTMNKQSGRDNLLEKFQRADSKIISSNNGRNPDTKYKFDVDYYQLISNSEFGLCPNHAGGEWYVHDNAWTYRFMETVFCRAIPIVFRKTPLGKNFVKDIEYVWDDDNHKIANYDKIVEDNYNKALRYWTLQPDEITAIQQNPASGTN
jgi:hypothetical protein